MTCLYTEKSIVSKIIGPLLAVLLASFTVSAVAASPGSENHTGGALQPVHVGKKYLLLNPFTGSKEEGRVEKIVSNTPHHVSVAYVRFTSGHVQPYATEYLHFAGHASKELAHLNHMQDQVVSAIHKILHLDASMVAVHVADGPNVTPTAFTSWENEGAFIQEWKRRGRNRRFPMAGLTGFAPADDSTIFLHRYYGAYDYQTRVHEVLHVLSQACAREILSAKLDGLNEGITQYFAYYVTKKSFGITPDREHPYYRHFLLAEKIAKKIGHEKFLKLFFGEGVGLFIEIQKEYDGANRGALKKEARALPDTSI